MTSLTQAMLKNSKLETIKKLQKLSAQRTDLHLQVESHEEKMCVCIKTRYWTWYPFHYSECPDADTGDLFLTQEDLYSKRIDELVQSLQLLDNVRYYVETYKLSEEGLKDLVFTD